MRALATASALLLVLATPGLAETGDVGLLVLDLEADGLHLSDAYYPVLFDTDGDGEPERTSWTAQAQNEAFLWLDLDHDGRVDHGAELVGGAMPLPADLPRAHGFDVLRAFDRPSLGGDGDGSLSPGDRVWSELRLWIDADHDGESSPDETSELRPWGIRQIPLSHETGYDLDGGLNLHRRWVQLEVSPPSPRGAGREVRIARIVEVFFDRAPEDDLLPSTRQSRLALTSRF